MFALYLGDREFIFGGRTNREWGINGIDPSLLTNLKKTLNYISKGEIIRVRLAQ